MTNNASLQKLLGPKKSFRQRADKPGLFRHQHKKVDKMGRKLSGSSWSDSDPECEESATGISPKTEAIATVCPNQRRPSVDTEVLLAFAKVRAYAPEDDSDKKRESNPVSPLKKLKNKVLKLKFSSR